MKYKLWDSLNRKWYEGSFAITNDEEILLYSNVDAEFRESHLLGIWEGDLVLLENTYIKDKNGKEIYEGDILVAYPDTYLSKKINRNIYKIDTNKPNFENLLDVILRLGSVEYQEDMGRFIASCEKYGGSVDLTQHNYHWEVIGNKFEHPDLLK